ncbi:hypothetical protein HDU84_007835, partial [Entophlyctis sp. JEL0112]
MKPRLLTAVSLSSLASLSVVVVSAALLLALSPELLSPPPRTYYALCTCLSLLAAIIPRPEKLNRSCAGKLSWRPFERCFESLTTGIASLILCKAVNLQQNWLELIFALLFTVVSLVTAWQEFYTGLELNVQPTGHPVVMAALSAIFAISTAW